jgi:hypothetical protein
MEFLALVGLVVVAWVVGGPILLVIVLRRTGAQSNELTALKKEVHALRGRMSEIAPDSGVASEKESASVDVPPGTAAEMPPQPTTPPAGGLAPPPETVGRPRWVDRDWWEGGPQVEGTEDVERAETEAFEPPSPPAESVPAQSGVSESVALTERRSAIDFETLIGTKWLLRVGLGILAIALALFARSVLPQLPAVAKVALAYASAMALFGVGRVFEHRLERFARPVMAAGLAFGFFVAFSAHFVPAMRAVSLPVSIGWMALSMGSVLAFATRWRSQPTALLGIVLGHISAFVAVGGAPVYSLVLISFLALTAAALMLRHSWMAVGMVGVVASYASHLLWFAPGASTQAGNPGFFLNLAFLTSYYGIFLIGDVLWWRRDRDRDEGELTAVQVRSARQIGPTNLVLFASLVSMVFFMTRAEAEAIEWFYLTLGGFQGLLAWYYWQIEHRDFLFYPAFGTILWTLGWFAALDAMALNLVLTTQALLLLLAAHYTRLLTFHVLAQLALVVAFVHYLYFPSPAGSSIGLALGGLGVAAVYLLKASLEEIWYGFGPDSGELADLETSGEAHGLEAHLGGILRNVGPYLAPAHAALGGFVLVRELARALGLEPGLVIALILAHGLLAGIVLMRRSGALLFAFTAVAFAGPYFASESGLTVPTLALLVGMITIALVVLHTLARPAYESISHPGVVHAQAVGVVVLVGFGAAVTNLDFSPDLYLMAMVVPFLLFAFQERMVSIEGLEVTGPSESSQGLPAWLSPAVCLGSALLVYPLSLEVFGPLPVTLAWVAGWTLVFALIARVRGSTQMLLAAIALLWLGYMAMGTQTLDVWGAALQSIWIGSVVTLVPLILAIGMDRAVGTEVSDEDPTAAPANLVTLATYGLGLLLVGALAHAQLPAGWFVLAASGFAFGLMVLGPRIGADRAVPSGVAAFVVLHWTVMVQAQAGDASGGVIVLAPLLLFSILTLLAERCMTDESALPMFAEMWGRARTVLVILAALTGMLAVYGSEPVGPQWATAGWAVLAAGLMVGGFAIRASSYRRVALAMLGICLLRVFVVDTQGLSDSARTGVFLVLGLCLVGVAWLYNRFSEELKRWL